MRKTSLWALKPWIPSINSSKDPAALEPFECTNIENRITGVRDSFKKREGINKDWDSGTSGTNNIIGGSDYWFLSAGVKTQTKVSLDDTGAFRKYSSSGTITAITNDGSTLTTPSVACFRTFNGKLIMAMDGSTNRVKKYSGSGNVSDLEAGYDHTTVSRSSTTTTRTIVLGESFKGVNGEKIVVAGMGEATYNGNFTVTSVTTTTLTNDTISYTAGSSLNEGSTADTGGSVDGLAPNGSILGEHQGRLLMNDKDDLDRLHWSAPGDHEKWWGYGDSGASDFGLNDNDPVGLTGIFPTFNGDLFVAKKTKLFRVVGVIPFHQIQLVSDSIGCISHESIAAIDKSDIIWASQKGIHSLAATQAYGDYEEAFISKDIQASFNEDWDETRQKYLKGRYWSTENLYLITVTEESLGTTNNCVWAYHVGHKRWLSRWPNLDCESIFIANDSDKVRPYFGSSTGRIYKGQSGNRYDTSESGTDSAISLLAETGVIFPQGNPYSISAFKKAVLFYTPRGNQTITVTAKVDNFANQSESFDESSGGTPLGTGWTLGTTALGSEGMFAPYSRQIDGYGYGIKLTISESARLSSYSIEGIGIEYQPMEIQHDVNKGALEN